ncbi:lens fiber membrane intrinsic protein-like [Hydractinia symbiolongicarpus]|uniref:lens fiber membrane intrinsic protein-like n=1 Tax=Hydractinia symbiolongicarpus TaxID=13093 RepID=UPI002550AF23|nr:lens fiber membrane intrinsic protein-like [Hydractinia symbiolongicarpus]
MKVLKIIPIVCGFFAFLFTCVSVGGNAWLTDKSGDVLYGLWKTCNEHSGCEKHQKVEDWIKSTRAMTLLALVCTLIGIISSIVNIFCTHLAVSIVKCVGYGLSVIFMISGLAIFMDETTEHVDKYGMKYSWALVLGWVAMIFSLVSLILSIVNIITGDKKVASNQTV